MFKNIGKKLKVLAKVMCWVGIIISFVIAIRVSNFIYNLYDYSEYVNYWNKYSYVYIGIVIFILGSLFSWIWSFFTYGFGELIDKTTEISYNISGKCMTDNNSTSGKDKNTFSLYSEKTKALFGSDCPVVATEVAENIWTCPECCRTNSNENTECKCGYKLKVN